LRAPTNSSSCHQLDRRRVVRGGAPGARLIGHLHTVGPRCLPLAAARSLVGLVVTRLVPLVARLFSSSDAVASSSDCAAAGPAANASAAMRRLAVAMADRVSMRSLLGGLDPPFLELVPCAPDVPWHCATWEAPAAGRPTARYSLPIPDLSPPQHHRGGTPGSARPRQVTSANDGGAQQLTCSPGGGPRPPCRRWVRRGARAARPWWR
jgi:hypothetical protein